jgi:integrase/recombinase XerD
MAKSRVYNKIYNEDDWNAVLKENKNIMQDYLDEYTQQKKKKSTISQYKNDIRIIMIYILKNCENKCIFQLVKKDFRRFSIWLSEELHLSNARSNRLMSACRSLLTYCENDDDYEYDTNVAKKVKGLPKEPVKTDEDSFFMSFDQIMKVRQELINRGELQLAVLHMISFDSAARRNELAQVKKQGLLDGNKTNIVIGKRGKQFPLCYLNDTKELIKQYLDERGEDKVDSLWIIGSGENKREASYDNLYEFVLRIRKIFSEIEGRELNIFPHSYRHSRTEVLLQGEDLRIVDSSTGLPRKFTLEQVQKILHHSDPKTTQSYSKDHTEEEIDAMLGI